MKKKWLILPFVMLAIVANNSSLTSIRLNRPQKTLLPTKGLPSPILYKTDRPRAYERTTPLMRPVVVRPRIMPAPTIAAPADVPKTVKEPKEIKEKDKKPVMPVKKQKTKSSKLIEIPAGKKAMPEIPIAPEITPKEVKS